MNQVGITLYSRAFGQARLVCEYVSDGHSPTDVANELINGNPTWEWEQAETFVTASIGIYCPGEASALTVSVPQVDLRKV